jgi:hypothetical protein
MNRPSLASLVAALSIAAFNVCWAAPRTFVSGTGNDANPCSISAPCRSFAVAINAADAGGEVIALDTAGYGPFAINKSISVISPPGVIAAISNGVGVPSAYGNSAAVDVNAGPSDRIVLRGLNVNIASGGTSGVVIRSAGVVHIENSALKGSGNTIGSGRAIFAYPASPLQLFIKDTNIRSFEFGVHLLGLSAGVTASADRLRVQDTYFGVNAVYSVQAVMRDVIVTGNHNGFYAYANLVNGAASLQLERCTASHNTTWGVYADPNSAFFAANVTISNCLITNNNIGVQGSTLASGTGGFIHTRQNNTIRENSSNNVLGDLLPESPL